MSKENFNPNQNPKQQNNPNNPNNPRQSQNPNPRQPNQQNNPNNPHQQKGNNFNNFDAQQFNFDQFQRDIKNFIQQQDEFTQPQKDAFAKNFQNEKEYFQQKSRSWYGEHA